MCRTLARPACAVSSQQLRTRSNWEDERDVRLHTQTPFTWPQKNRTTDEAANNSASTSTKAGKNPDAYAHGIL